MRAPSGAIAIVQPPSPELRELALRIARQPAIELTDDQVNDWAAALAEDVAAADD